MTKKESKSNKTAYFFSTKDPLNNNNDDDDGEEFENHNYEDDGSGQVDDDVVDEEEDGAFRDFSMLEEEYYENEYDDDVNNDDEGYEFGDENHHRGGSGDMVEFEIEDDIVVRTRISNMDSFSVIFLRKLCLEANHLASSNQYQRACGRYELALDVHEKLHEEFNIAIDRLTDKYDERERKEEEELAARRQDHNDDDDGANNGNEFVDEELVEAKHQLVTNINALMEDRREGLVDRAKILNNMAAVLQQTQEYEESYQTYEKALCVKKIVLGEKHFSVGHTLYNMSYLLIDNEQYEDALVLLQNTIDIYLESFGDHNQATIDVMNQYEEIKQLALSQQQREDREDDEANYHRVSNDGKNETSTTLKSFDNNPEEAFEKDLTSRDRNSISLNRTTLNQRIHSGASTMTDFSMDHFKIDKPRDEIKNKNKKKGHRHNNNNNSQSMSASRHHQNSAMVIDETNDSR